MKHITSHYYLYAIHYKYVYTHKITLTQTCTRYCQKVEQYMLKQIFQQKSKLYSGIQLILFEKHQIFVIDTNKLNIIKKLSIFLKIFCKAIIAVSKISSTALHLKMSYSKFLTLY